MAKGAQTNGTSQAGQWRAGRREGAAEKEEEEGRERGD
jgi:hypothetical protein